jgi:pimeloyl-ACP methyl ester carboxylesterase
VTRLRRLPTTLLVGGALLLGSSGAALASGTIAPTGGAGVAGVPAPAGSIEWKPCPEDNTADCATVAVPVDWKKPRGATTNLAVARLRAADPNARIGTLFINPGGPGGSGVDFALAGREVFSPDIVRRFDIIGIDPRGVARSHPVRCPGELYENPPSEFPDNAAQYANLLAFHKKLGEGCRRLTGPLFDHVDTASVARDFDAVRAALGEKKISYYGVSYGTLIGQTYAEMFPGRLRAIVLDSNMDHSITRALRFMATEAAGVEGSYREFAKWCGTSAACALRGLDPIKVLDELMAKADRGELHFPDEPDVILTPEDLAGGIQGAMYDPAVWPPFSQDLAALRGSGSGNARASGAFAAEPVEDPFQAVFCNDWKLPVRNFAQLDSYRAKLRKIAPHTRLNPLGWIAVSACQGYPLPTVNPQHRYDIHGTPPILMTNSLWDPATVYPWAVNAARQIPAATLLTYDGVGHGNYFLSTCSRQAIDRYLLTVRTPPQGTHCPAELPGASTLRLSAKAKKFPTRPFTPAWP